MEGKVKGALLFLLVGCAEPVSCPPADLAPIEGEPAYAFVASDYASSAVGILDADGDVLREAWIDSGTTPPGIVAAVSGDVVLGSSPLAPCVVTVIDRSGTDVLTFLDACSDDVLIGQLDVGPSFYANPQDAIAIDETRALVSRSEPNGQPGAAEIERGNDLLVVDWRAGEILSRIDLSALDHAQGERVYARPERMALLENEDARVVVVGLARLTGHYTVGPGALGIVDLATLEPRALELEGLSNCREVDAVPGAPNAAFVTCNGTSFGTADDRREGAGVVALALEPDGGVSVRAVWRAADHPDAPVFNTWTVPLSAERVVAIAMGDVGRELDDRAAVLAFDGEPEMLVEADDAFVLGDGTFDAERGLLLLPDARAGTIRRFAMESARELEPAVASACRALPPREIRRIAP